MRPKAKRRGQQHRLHATVAHLWSRYPFTHAILVAVGIVTLATRTHKQRLSRAWQTQLGFGADDLWPLQWRRLLSAPFVTHGPHAFSPSYVMLALTAAAAEHTTGSRQAALTFFGVHSITLITEGIMLRLLAYVRPTPFTSRLTRTRDVGPSAGYFGLLGLTCVRLPAPWRTISVGGVMGMLITLATRPAHHGKHGVLQVQADLAHLLAFPLGMLGAMSSRRQKTG